MGKYAEAAHRAKRTCDLMAEAPDCLVPSNQLVFNFLQSVSLG